MAVRRKLYQGKQVRLAARKIFKGVRPLAFFEVRVLRSYRGSAHGDTANCCEHDGSPDPDAVHWVYSEEQEHMIAARQDVPQPRSGLSERDHAN